MLPVATTRPTLLSAALGGDEWSPSRIAAAAPMTATGSLLRRIFIMTVLSLFFSQ
jgi:hypothetical protein